MSASLVGSEMCIRDRLGGPRHDVLGPRLALELVLLSGQASIFVLPVGAVSYTHLTLPTICSV
eukprot:2204420-Alexandrium_andersonii.AAC.1